MGNHTPGPWAVFGSDGNYVQQQDEQGRWGLIVADCSMTDEGAANARLIAAAPAMFEALRIADAIPSNTHEFSTTHGGRIPVTKVSEAREIVRAALSQASSGETAGGGP